MLSTPLTPLIREGERESIDYVSSPLTKGGERGDIPPDKGGKGGLNTLIVLYYVFYVNILFYNSYKIINYILYIIITV